MLHVFWTMQIKECRLNIFTIASNHWPSMVNNTSSSFITIEHEKKLVYEPLISYDEHYNEPH
jgi:hypothetical protein